MKKKDLKVERLDPAATTLSASKAWNVISGGPSREHLTAADLIPDSPVVTVNRAIDVIDKGIHVDFACFADPPKHIFKLMGLDRYLQPPIQVWCPRPAMYIHNNVPTFHDMVSFWEPFLPASVGIRTTPYGTVPNEDGQGSRYVFCLLAALLRVMLFRPQRVRVLCADMMGSWAAGKTEEECERLQSDLEQARRELGRLQQKINATKGQAPVYIFERDQLRQNIQELEKAAPKEGFKRWAHERYQLKVYEKKAQGMGTKVEWVTPKGTVLA